MCKVRIGNSHAQGPDPTWSLSRSEIIVCIHDMNLNFKPTGKMLQRSSYFLASVSTEALTMHSIPLYLSFRLNSEYLENVCLYIVSF